MDQSLPKISVILPVHLKNEHLELAMKSIFEQSFKDFELIVVANNCSEDLWDFLKDYQNKINDDRFKIFRTAIGQIGFNLNFAINTSRAELIARMDADDISYPNRLAIQYNFLLQNPDVDVVGSSFDVIDVSGQIVKNQEMPLTNNAIRKSLPYRNPLCHPSVMFRKNTIIKHAGYLGGRYSEDYSLWLRLQREKTIGFANIPTPLLQYRINDFQSKGSRLAYAEVAGLMWTEFLFQLKLKYLLGFFIATFKIFRAKKVLR